MNWQLLFTAILLLVMVTIIIGYLWRHSHTLKINRAVVNSLTEGVIVFDAQNHVVSINPVAQEITGYKVPKALGKTNTQIFSRFPELIDHYNHQTNTNIEIVVQNKQEDHYLDVQITPLQQKKSHFKGQLVVLKDITQRKQAEQTTQRLLKREQEQRLASETLREVTLAVASQINLNAVLNEILQQTHRIIPYITAHIMLLDGNDLHIGAKQGYTAFGIDKVMAELKQSLTDLPLDREVIRAKKPLVISDTSQEPRWLVQPETAWVKSHIVAPLASQERVLGILRLDSDIPNQFSPQDIQYLAPLASAAAIAMENTRLLTAEQQRTEELTSLITSATAVSASLDIAQVLHIVAEQMTKLLAVDSCAISQLNQVNNTLSLAVEYYGVKNWEVEEGWFSPVNSTNYPLTHQVLTNFKPVQLQIDMPHLDDAERHFMEKSDITSLLIIPLVVQDKAIGLAELMTCSKKRIFSDREISLIQILANQAAIAIKNAQLLASEQDKVKQLATARDRALEASQLKSELLGRVSHELRTPLNVILGYTEMLHASIFGNISEEQRHTTQKIINSAVNLTNRVNELLNQAQLEAKNLKLLNVSFAPIELIEYIQSNLGKMVKNKDLALTCHLSDELPPILYGDPKRLCQMLDNLIKNAIKFTDEGKIDIHIFKPKPNEWALQVSDTGLGIHPKNQTKVFDPFWQVDSSATREYGGTGLGLSIVKQLTGLMDGEITLQSKVNQGSTFTITLPLTLTPDIV